MDSNDSRSGCGRVTLPVQQGLDGYLPGLIRHFGADAVRNSDGTVLPDSVANLGLDIYSTYFPARGDQEWAQANLGACPQVFLLSPRVSALVPGDLTIPLMRGYLTDQICPNTECDMAKYWQVLDRTSGVEVPATQWRYEGAGADASVVVTDAAPGHAYTVAFLAYQRWDGTQMYNYITNGWESDPTRVKEIPYDVRNPAAWARARERFAEWLRANPRVTWVRFTTFFYHFTLVFNAQRREALVDWFGYTACVSPQAIEEFEAATGFSVRPEDFVAGGRHSGPFTPPSPLMRAWIDFQSRFVAARAGELTRMARAAGKKTIMFLGDSWIGTEPYGPHFAAAGLDGVVGSVGSAATTRMITDIPGVDVREGRMLPYFFPDVFHPGGDPTGEVNRTWLAVRRAVLRSPLQRIGFGGYLSLAMRHPDFMTRTAQICEEFRCLADLLERHRPACARVRVGVLNSWGALRSWQTHMVAHALHYDFTAPYVGALEALAGLPFRVTFMDFEQAVEGALDDVDVVINCGAAGDAFSGGSVWADPRLQACVRAFVAGGGGLIGIGDPTWAPTADARFQLADVFGVDREDGQTLSTDRYASTPTQHFVTADGAPSCRDLNPASGYVVPVSPACQVLAGTPTQVGIACHAYGRGRAIYAVGMPYSPLTSRILQRACYWAAGVEGQWGDVGISTDPRVEVTSIPDIATLIICNTVMQRVATGITHSGVHYQVTLEPGEVRFLQEKQVG